MRFFLGKWRSLFWTVSSLIRTVRAAHYAYYHNGSTIMVLVKVVYKRFITFEFGSIKAKSKFYYKWFTIITKGSFVDSGLLIAINYWTDSLSLNGVSSVSGSSRIVRHSNSSRRSVYGSLIERLSFQRGQFKSISTTTEKRFFVKQYIMARIILFFLVSTVFAYGGYHVSEFLPEFRRNWLGIGSRRWNWFREKHFLNPNPESSVTFKL